MGEVAVEDLAQVTRDGKVLAGIDVGTKTIGLAVSDRGLRFAHPRGVIMRKKFTIDAEILLDTLFREQVGAIVVGLPVNMDGSESPRSQGTRAFMRNLMRIQDVTYTWWDERLSTVAAERALIEMDMSRARRAERIDSAAAAFILQGVLDRLEVLRED